MQKLTHFRCVFDVTPVGDIARPWPALIGEIAAWIGRNERTERSKFKGWFYGGGSWTGSGPRRPRVESKVLSEGGDPPEMWAARYEHFDTSNRWRRWTTDIGISQVGPREWRLAMTVSHWLRPDYVGAEPEPPSPSSPRLIRELVKGARWVCRVGSVRLKAAPISLKVGRGHEFVQLLEDPQRLVPVVLVSCERESGVPMIDTVDLAAALAGTAVVYVCESVESDDELGHLMPFRFRCPGGTVRIYAPGLDFDREGSWVRHRFFSPSEIEELGDAEVTAMIVRALTRSDAWRGLQSSISSVDDIDARVRERRLAQLRENPRTREQEEELLRLYEEEIEDLDRQKQELSGMLDEERKGREQLENRLAARDYDLERLKKAADEAREVARSKEEALRAVLELDEWPTEPVAVADLAVSLFSDRLTLTREARNSLVRSEFARRDDSSAVLWRCLRAMATDLHDMVMSDRAAEAIAQEFHKRSGFELAWTETKHTKRDNKLMAQRRLEYDGRLVDMTPHVKWSNQKTWLRVHFFVDKAKQKIVIGHCGDHLDTYGTRRRGH